MSSRRRRRNSKAFKSMLVDSHCHLDFPDFADERAAIVERAAQAGVARMVTISTRVRRFPDVLAIAEAFDAVYCSVGTHPHNAAEEPDVTAEDLVRLSAHPKVVAIGEAGLDYHYDKSPRDAQAQGLRTHIAAARQADLPLVIHARSADADMAAILEEETKKGAFAFILHCFSSGRELAETGVKLGGYVSFSGILTFKNSGELRDIAASVMWPIPRRCSPKLWVSAPTKSRRSQPPISSGCSPRCRVRSGTPERGGPAALHHSGLRLVAGHAAHHRRLG
jgi:TatD DNase family protein